MPHLPLTVTIICKNAETHIEKCLDSVQFADEILVLDSGSTDNTVDICRRYNVRLIETDWPGFGAQKNRALDLATHDWILSLDADEVVSPKLRVAIETLLSESPQQHVYEIKRLSNYCGKWMRHGDWKNDWIPRLFQKQSARFNERPVHEALEYTDPAGRLSGLIYHYSFDTLEQVIDKMNQYSTLGVSRVIHKKCSIWTALSHAIWSFIRGYGLRRGFLDGKAGLLLAISNAEGVFYRYAKASFQKNNPGSI